MTSLEAIAQWLAKHKARPAHMLLVDLADGTGDMRTAVANVVSVVLSLAAANAEQAKAIRELQEKVKRGG